MEGVDGFALAYMACARSVPLVAVEALLAQDSLTAPRVAENEINGMKIDSR